MPPLEKFLRWLPPLVWMAGIFFLSSRTGLPGPAWLSVPGHIVEYGVLSALLYLALSQTTSLDRAAVAFLAVALATLYGTTDELHQSFVPGRQSDPIDLMVDFLAATGVAAIAAVRTRAYSS